MFLNGVLGTGNARGPIVAYGSAFLMFLGVVPSFPNFGFGWSMWGGKIKGKPFSLTENCVLYGSGLDTCPDSVLMLYLVGVVKWLVWASRCEALFDKSHATADQLLLRIKSALREHIRAD